jgi:hypothetical protein
VSPEAPLPPAASPQLDPFAFPPETRGRFQMLMLAAVLVAAHVGLTISAWTQDPRMVGNMRRVMEESRQKGPHNLAEVDPAHTAAVSDLNLRFFRQSGRLFLVWLLPPAVMVSLLGAGAALLYRLHPHRVRRRQGTRPLTAERAPRVVAELQLWAARCGISPPPALEWCPGMAQGMAFGLKRRQVLLLHGSPEAIERTWSGGDTSRVIALHELGHIANGDAHEREGARAIWLTLIGLMLLFVAFLPGRGRLAWITSLQCAALLAFVWMTWTGLLRVRETYADWRVASWGMGAPLQRLLRLEEAAGPGRPSRRWSWPWQLHPPLHRRAAVLKDAGALFRVSADLSLLTGIQLGVVAASLPIVAGVLMFLGALPAGLLYLVIMPHIAALPAALKMPLAVTSALILNLGASLLMATLVLLGLSFLVTNTLGLQVQREAIADLAAGRHSRWRYLPLWRPAAIVALGTEIGFLIVPMSMFSPLFPAWPAVPLWLAGFTCLIWLWLIYVRAMARLALGTQARAANPRLPRRLVNLASAAVLTVLFWPAAVARFTLLFTNTGLLGSVFAGHNPRRVFVFVFFITTFVLFGLAVALFTLCAGASLAAVGLSLAKRRSHCPTCSHALRPRLVVGRTCPGCDEPLARWVFLSGEKAAGGAQSCATK